MSGNDEQPATLEEWLRLGQMGLDLGYKGQAETYFDHALTLDPTDRRAMLGKARATEDEERRREFATSVLRLFPDDAEALALLEDSGTQERRPIAQAPEAQARVASETSARPRRRPWLLAIGAAILLLVLAIGLVVAVMRYGPQMMARLSPSVAPTAAAVIPGGDLDPDRLLQAQRCTALVLVANQDGSQVSRGSGVFVDASGLVLTNRHVLMDDRGEPINPDNLAFIGLTRDVRRAPDEWYIGAVVASDEARDLATLRILCDSAGRELRGARFETVVLADSDGLRLGQPLVGLGYPTLGGETLTLTRGTMAGFASNSKGVQLGKTDSELLPGSSGGAVLDEQGNLVGIVSLAYADERTQGRLSYFVLSNETQGLMIQARQVPLPQPDVSWLTALREGLLQ